jgi:hypothetical protein
MSIPPSQGDMGTREFRANLERGLEGASEGSGDFVRLRQPSGSIAIFWIIIGLVICSMIFLALFTVGLWFQNAWLQDPSLGGPTAPTQQMLSFWMGMFFVDLALIIDLYRKHFVEDAIITRRRRPKYIPGEDVTKTWDSQWNKPKANRVTWYSERQKIRPSLKKRG